MYRAHPSPVAFPGTGKADVQVDRPFDRLDHILESDIGSGSGEREATLGPAMRPDHSRLRQRLEDLGQKSRGNILDLRNDGKHADLSLFLPGEVKDTANTVFASTRQLHSHPSCSGSLEDK